MKKSVYLESSVISYYVNEINSNLKIAAEQRMTRDWWERALPQLDPYVSQFVLDEISNGQPAAAKARLESIRGMKVLPVTEDVYLLAEAYVKKLALPKDDQVDAFHMAMAAIHELNFLVSWNCKHIANAFKFPLIRRITVGMGYKVPTICTPQQLMEVSNGK